MRTYKVWVEIEELEDGEPTNCDPILPDSLGEFYTLDNAIELQREVVLEFNPEMLKTSDVRRR